MALDRGWRDRAASHFDKAISSAEGDLAEVLLRSGDWFGRTVEITWAHQFQSPRVVLRTVNDAVKTAANESIKRTFEESVRNPWTRVFRFGAETAGLRSIVAAELQASWVGAIWILPEIRQQYARIALPSQGDADDVGRALGSWIRGGVKDIPRVIEAFERLLDPQALTKMIVDDLHEGRSIKKRSDWIATCTALWDQLPEPLCLEIVSSYEPLIPGSPHDDLAAEVVLFASLVMRVPSAWGIAITHMAAAEVATVVRSLHPSLVKFVPTEAVQICFDAFTSTQGVFADEWSDRGWVTAAMLWQRLDSPHKQVTGSFVQLIPDTQAPSVALNVSSLASSKQLIRARDTAINKLEQDLANAKMGKFVHWGSQPAAQLGRASLALGRATKATIDILVQTANARECSSGQRNAALLTLTTLVEEGVAKVPVKSVPIEPAAVGGHPFEDGEADLRLERVSRVGLRVRINGSSRNADILEATRDSDARVRETAMATAAWVISRRRNPVVALETSLFGGLYDPSPSVQSLAAQAVARDGLHDAALERVAMRRIEETFDSMPRTFAQAWPVPYRTVIGAMVYTGESALWLRRTGHLLFGLPRAIDQLDERC